MLIPRFTEESIPKLGMDRMKLHEKMTQGTRPFRSLSKARSGHKAQDTSSHMAEDRSGRQAQDRSGRLHISCSERCLHHRGMNCIFTVLQYRGLCCSWRYLHHRGLSCIFTCLQYRGLSSWRCLHHRGLSCIFTCLQYRGLSCSWRDYTKGV